MVGRPPGGVCPASFPSGFLGAAAAEGLAAGEEAGQRVLLKAAWDLTEGELLKKVLPGKGADCPACAQDPLGTPLSPLPPQSDLPAGPAAPPGSESGRDQGQMPSLRRDAGSRGQSGTCTSGVRSRSGYLTGKERPGGRWGAEPHVSIRPMERRDRAGVPGRRRRHIPPWQRAPLWQSPLGTGPWHPLPAGGRVARWAGQLSLSGLHLLSHPRPVSVPL